MVRSLIYRAFRFDRAVLFVAAIKQVYSIDSSLTHESFPPELPPTSLEARTR